MREVMLTTVDNPFSPFTQFNEWYAYDRLLGHNSSALLARVANTSPDTSDEDMLFFIEEAIDEIVRTDITKLFKKVEESD
jgi:hypothetical protein